MKRISKEKHKGLGFVQAVNIDKVTGCKPVGWRLIGDLCR